MPKFGADVTSMTPVDTRGFNRPLAGVEDKSGALDIANTTGLIKNVGTTAIDAYKGITVAVSGNEQTDLVQEFLDRRAPSTIFESLSKENKNPTLKQFSAANERYKKALDQGTMKPEEFSTRMLVNLRSAVNKNPGMIKELTEETQNTLELSGITSLIEQDKKGAISIEKAKEEERTYYMGIAKDLKIPLPRNTDGSIDMPSLKAKTAIVQNEKATIEAADRQDSFTEDQVRNFGTTYAIGKINQATDLAIQTLSDPSIPYDKAITNANFILDSVEQGFISDPRIGRILDKPSVQAMLKTVKDQVSTVRTNLKGFASKEEASAYLKNTTEMARNQQTLDVMKTVNVQALDSYSKLVSAIGMPYLTSKHGDLLVGMLKDTNRLMDGLPIGGTDSYKRASPTEKPIVVQTVDHFAREGGKEGGEKDVLALSNSLSAINTDMTSLPIEYKFEFYRDYIKTLGISSNKEGLKKITDEARQKVNVNINDYATITLTDMQKTVKKYEDRGIKINMDILPDGRLSVSTNNDQITTELTKKYTTRINDTLAAYANVNGYNSTKEAYAKFYTQYQSFFIGEESTPLDKSLVNPKITRPGMEPTAGDQEVVDLMRKSISAGASIEEIAKILKTTPEWVKSNLE